ncbi:MAG: AzlC family ABC transporter permease [Marinobacter sp.]|uniref:AzlC family ABC transporter permease n=1 Tax=Marinobacter sp. TaxID=50741 RepID=UPI00299EF8D4|nr:AzlC family ABC transporter permease [Marinobacter sp.]MDX1635279.1 AzlC family ABC transporter permease [Marinobacter sp.]
MFGYVPLGMAFGVLFTAQLDYSWWVAPLMAVTIFAGAAQILAVGLLASEADLVAVFVAMLVLNSRHLFYGLSLLGRFSGAGWRKLYLIFGLTDETYSLLTSRSRGPDAAAEQRVDFLITLFNQSYWIVGCALGAWLGSRIQFNSTGIEFALVALFIVLAIEQYKALGQMLPLWLGAAGAGIAVAVLPASHQLLGAIVLVAAALLASYRLSLQPAATREPPGHG